MLYDTFESFPRPKIEPIFFEPGHPVVSGFLAQRMPSDIPYLQTIGCSAATGNGLHLKSPWRPSGGCPPAVRSP